MKWWKRSRANSSRPEDEVALLARAMADDLQLLHQRGRAPSAGLVAASNLLATMASAAAPRQGGLLHVQILAGELEDGVARLAWLLADSQHGGSGVSREAMELVAHLSQRAEQLVDGLRTDSP